MPAQPGNDSYFITGTVYFWSVFSSEVRSTGRNEVTSLKHIWPGTLKLFKGLLSQVSQKALSISKIAGITSWADSQDCFIDTETSPLKFEVYMLNTRDPH